MTKPTPSISTEQLLQLLADSQRWKVLQIISDHDDTAISLEDLAAELTDTSTATQNASHSRIDRKKTELYHSHLPKLAEYDILEFEQDREAVTGGPAFDTAESLLHVLQAIPTESPTDSQCRRG